MVCICLEQFCFVLIPIVWPLVQCSRAILRAVIRFQFTYQLRVDNKISRQQFIRRNRFIELEQKPKTLFVGCSVRINIGTLEHRNGRTERIINVAIRIRLQHSRKQQNSSEHSCVCACGRERVPLKLCKQHDTNPIIIIEWAAIFSTPAFHHYSQIDKLIFTRPAVHRVGRGAWWQKFSPSQHAQTMGEWKH